MNLPLILCIIMDKITKNRNALPTVPTTDTDNSTFQPHLMRFTIETAPTPASCQLPNLTLTLTPSSLNSVELQTGGVVSVSDNDGLWDDAVRPCVVCFSVDTASGRNVLGVCYSGYGFYFRRREESDVACLEWNWIIVRYCSYCQSQYILYSLMLCVFNRSGIYHMLHRMSRD